MVKRIAAAVAAHPHAMLISDEIYATLRYGDASHCSPASLPGMKDRVITLHGLSKIAAVTGWRLGWVVAPMLTERGETLAKILTRIQGQSLSHTSSLVMPPWPRSLEEQPTRIWRTCDCGLPTEPHACISTCLVLTASNA